MVGEPTDSTFRFKSKHVLPARPGNFDVPVKRMQRIRTFVVMIWVLRYAERRLASDIADTALLRTSA